MLTAPSESYFSSPTSINDNYFLTQIMLSSHHPEHRVFVPAANFETIIPDIRRGLESPDLQEIADASQALLVLNSAEINNQLSGALVGAVCSILIAGKKELVAREAPNVDRSENPKEWFDRLVSLSEVERGKLLNHVETLQLRMATLERLHALVLLAGDATIPHLVSNIMGNDEELRASSLSAAATISLNGDFAELKNAGPAVVSQESKELLKDAARNVEYKVPIYSPEKTCITIILRSAD